MGFKSELTSLFLVGLKQSGHVVALEKTKGNIHQIVIL